MSNYREQNKFKKILFEEIDKVVDNLNLKNVKTKKVITELFDLNANRLLRTIGDQEISQDTELDTELWEWFLATIDESMEEFQSDWVKLLHDQKLKILCNKYFTKKDLLDQKELEKSLRKEIKKYFSSLQNFSDLEGFKTKVSNLPSEFLTNLTRYFFKISPIIKEKIIITKKEFSERVNSLKKERIKLAEKISSVSNKYQVNLEIEKIKTLVDNGVFFEDNLINRAINEYIVKLSDHKDAASKIKETFSNTFLFDLKSQSENSLSYVKHQQSLKEEDATEFFTKKGQQIGNKFFNAIEEAKKQSFDNTELIDKDSIFKEPTGKIESVTPPWDKDDVVDDNEENNNSDSNPSSTSSGGGTSGGGFSGGSDFGNSFTGPADLGASDVEGGPDVENLETGEGNDGDTPLPTDDNGLPVDFGSEETNPEATEDNDEEIPK